MAETDFANLSGTAWKVGDRCDTGQIIPGKYVVLTDPQELAGHLFEDVRPELRARIRPGDILVGGMNFGCGSSREHAPKAIRFAGLRAVVADSFARIFFRNALNIGLLAVPVPGISSEVEEGDRLSLDVRQGRLVNERSGKAYSFTPYEPFTMDMLGAGGIIPFTKQRLGLG